MNETLTKLAQAEAPRLEIPIPGVTLTSITEPGNYSVPWIGQYVSGVYTFMISIIGVVAAVMMIIGGFQYLTSAGDAGKIGKARKRIVDALIGVVLALGSYVTLYTINPALVEFNGLRLLSIETEVADYETLGTTNVETAQDGDSAESVGGSGPVPGSYTARYSNCPIQLFATTGKASKTEFQSKMAGVVTATNPRDRVIQIADIADACNVNWGSCGNTAGTITALAGVGTVSCLNSKDGNCNDLGKGRSIFSVSRTQRKFLFGWRCGVNKEYPGKARPVGECVDTASAAVAKVRDYLNSEKTAGRLPSNWPDGWANSLRPGDRVVIYNGNEDLVGAHAVIFMGWASGGKMQVVQGGGGGRGDEKSRARSGTWCVKSECGSRLIPLISAWSPD
ncbi:MAG: pilin [Patescibacteria group bacterium]|nr:MAG: pilin [Patescibacteria group bacterium]